MGGGEGDPVALACSATPTISLRAQQLLRLLSRALQQHGSFWASREVPDFSLVHMRLDLSFANDKVQHAAWHEDDLPDALAFQKLGDVWLVHGRCLGTVLVYILGQLQCAPQLAIHLFQATHHQIL